LKNTDGRLRIFISIDPDSGTGCWTGDVNSGSFGINPQVFDPIWMRGYPDWKHRGESAGRLRTGRYYTDGFPDGVDRDT